MSGIVNQLNRWGYVYILLFCYKWSSSHTDCSVFPWETHDGTLPESWQMMSRQCLNFKIPLQKCLALCTSSIYEAMYTYYCSCTNGHLPKQVVLSSYGIYIMAPYNKVDKWCLNSVYTLKFISKNGWHSALAQQMRPWIHIIVMVQMVIFSYRLLYLRTGNTWWNLTRKLTNDVQTLSRL